MPLHAQIACIGGNVVLAVLMLIAAAQGFSNGDFGLALFLTLLGGACAYTVWVLLKFRHYLSEEATLERQAHMAHLRKEVATETASATSETPPKRPIH
jgi:hypothetical protein